MSNGRLRGSPNESRRAPKLSSAIETPRRRTSRERRARALGVAPHRLLADLDAERVARQLEELELLADALGEVELGQLAG